MIVAFDTDECLVDRKNNKVLKGNVALLKVLSKQHKVYVWSGRGWENALRVVNELKLEKYISGVSDKYGTFKPDLAFDDQEIDLGKVNIKV